jgi:hypothetical protein
MKTFMYFLIATAVFSPATAFPQGLVPTLDSEYEFCQDRPTEPEWMQNLHVRESYKRLLIQSIYRLKSYQRAAEVDDCTCGTLFPQWTDAVQHFNDNYLHLERFESLQVRRDFQTQSNVLRQSVKELCVAEGNW